MPGYTCRLCWLDCSGLDGSLPGLICCGVGLRVEQDQEPVKVSVGVYDSAYEGQRAAESFSPPIWQEPTKNSR